MQTDKVKHRPCFFLMSTLACLASNTLYHQYHAHWNDLSWGHLKIAFSIVGKSQKVWDQVSSLKFFTDGIDKCLPFKFVHCFLLQPLLILNREKPMKRFNELPWLHSFGKSTESSNSRNILCWLILVKWWGGRKSSFLDVNYG